MSKENLNTASCQTDVICSTLKQGDIIEISGFYFTWEIKIGYSDVLKKEGVYAIAQGGLIHSDLVGDKILSVNGVAV